MKAMILAAGRGKRLGELTQYTPKPLLKIGNQSLIEYRLRAFAAVNITHVVINVCHLAKQIITALGDGSRYGVTIHYSYEPMPGGLETGGGIFQALTLLGQEPFIVINADIWTDYPLQQLIASAKKFNSLAHAVLVNNPTHNPSGDFSLQNGLVKEQGEPRFTYAGITLYHPKLFENCKAGHFRVMPLLRQAMAEQQVTGEYYSGCWV